MIQILIRKPVDERRHDLATVHCFESQEKGAKPPRIDAEKKPKKKQRFFSAPVVSISGNSRTPLFFKMKFRFPNSESECAF